MPQTKPENVGNKRFFPINRVKLDNEIIHVDIHQKYPQYSGSNYLMAGFIGRRRVGEEDRQMEDLGGICPTEKV